MSARASESFGVDDSAYAFLRHLCRLDRPLLLRSDIQREFAEFCAQEDASESRPAAEPFLQAEEAVIRPPWVCLAVRASIGSWRHLRFHVEAKEVDEVSTSQFLAIKEQLVLGDGADENWPVEIDLAPFNRDFPKLKEARSIGRGVEFLNRRLSSQIFVELGKGDQRLFDFLRVHQYRDTQLMLNDRITSVARLQSALRHALEYLSQRDPETSWSEFGHALQELGFEPGWGRNARIASESLRLLSDILEAPEPVTLERFLGRIPMIFSLAVISPHGFFGQANVLGLPDTGGQVVYILDQVRALEREMRTRIYDQGLAIEPRIVVLTRLIPESRGTTCHQRLEPVLGTENARILRVPFRTAAGEVVAHWVSRFDVWPYLERFSRDAERELTAELEGRPDLIIGNYSDGNLVASILSRRLHVTQCNIAHALEKTKYLYSDLYWKQNDAKYHFACQFTADLVAMNKADFIVTSTYQEIAGTKDSVGQYESYGTFSLPGLYRVVHGIDVFDPKFNVVSPGADADVFFTFQDESRRDRRLLREIEDLVGGREPRPDARGVLEDTEKPLVFTMARLDHIKNVTGLVDWYGSHPGLREQANLLVIAGHVDVNASRDREEREQIAKMHDLFDRHGLDGQARWLGIHLDKSLTGEVYRYIADGRGVFVQPALFEAFGLTVVEAMTSGLPTFATRYGGPLEIIEHGKSGFHIDPNDGAGVAELLCEFFDRAGRNDAHWKEISNGGMERARTHYTWERYAERMMTLSRIYGFWKYVTNLERAETHRYLEMFYALQYRPLANAVPAV